MSNVSLQPTEDIKCITAQSSPYVKKGFYDDIKKALAKNIKNEDDILQLNEILDKLIENPDPTSPSIEPFHVIDQCFDIFETEFVKPKPGSIWYKSIQQDFKIIQKDQDNQYDLESKLSLMTENKWEEIEEEFGKPPTPQFKDIKKALNIDTQHILSLYIQNQEYIKSLVNNKNNGNQPTVFENEQSERSLFNLMSKHYGIGPSINKSTKEKTILGNTTTSCFSPGYVQGLQRNPIGLTKILIVMRGTLLLCATDTMNESEAQRFQHSLGHKEKCPFTYYETKLINSQRVQYIPDIFSLANKLGKEHLNGRKTKLYVSLLRPGNIAVIKQGTYYCTFSPTNEYTWTKSALFAPIGDGPTQSILTLKSSLNCHHNFYYKKLLRHEACSICLGTKKEEYFGHYLCVKEDEQYKHLLKQYEKESALLKIAKNKSQSLQQIKSSERRNMTARWSESTDEVNEYRNRMTKVMFSTPNNNNHHLFIVIYI